MDAGKRGFPENFIAAEGENVRLFLGLSEQGWVNCSEEVRRRVGKELLHRGVRRKYSADESES